MFRERVFSSIGIVLVLGLGMYVGGLGRVKGICRYAYASGIQGAVAAFNAFGGFYGGFTKL